MQALHTCSGTYKPGTDESWRLCSLRLHKFTFRITAGTFTILFKLFNRDPFLYCGTLCNLCRLLLFLYHCHHHRLPFYGLLADKAERIINGTHGDDMTVFELIKDIPRILKRELRKQLFFLPLALLCLVISFVPVINIISPVLWFVLTSYFGCLQYADYSYDNHKISFNQMQQDLKGSFLSSFCMGAVIALSLSIPLLNLFVPAAAVCAGTRYFVSLQKLKQS